MVKSPISGKESVLIRSIDLKKLVKDYSESLGIDIAPLIPKDFQLGLYEDTENNFKFFYPFDIAGDSMFYQSLEKFDWYYMPWKWEHEVSQKYIMKGQKLLEIGCGSGGFLKKVSKKIGKENIVGVEMNTEAVKKLQKEGYTVLNTDIESFSLSNKDKFDVVCSFQVLEHVADVSSFLTAQLKCLRKGGKLIVSVPNNDSTLFKINLGGILNHPPHHFGLWNKSSLKSLEKFFPLKTKEFYFEPLQKYHVAWYISNFDNNLVNKPYKFIFKKFPFLKRCMHSLIHKSKSFIKGHTVVAVFEKI
jgi:2-polyprenyl-3-methyl-5-hydroxy-6-metoxy-1,4-benzoquinol methylase